MAGVEGVEVLTVEALWKAELWRCALAGAARLRCYQMEDVVERVSRC